MAAMNGSTKLGFMYLSHQPQPLHQSDHILFCQIKEFGMKSCITRTLHVVEGIIDEQGA